MLTNKLKYILGIALIIILLGLVAGGKLFLKTKTEKSSTFKTSEIVGIIHELGKESEFTIEKDGKIVYQNKNGDKPEVKYRLVTRNEVRAVRWSDLELGDRVSLETYYDTKGQIESRILKIYRTEERPIELY